MENEIDLIEKWKIKADHDLKIVEQGLKNDYIVTDVLCFHCQQAAEKFLKMFLVRHKIKFAKIHNIAVLLEKCKTIDKTFMELDNTIYLTNYAVQLRYPDDFYIPDVQETKDAYQDAIRVKKLY